MMKRRVRDTDAEKIKAIRARWDKAGLSPWRTYKDLFGWRVVEPRSCMGYDVLIACGLDGDTAALLAAVPEDLRFLLRLAEAGLKKRTR